jgi:hypothetical protein
MYTHRSEGQSPVFPPVRTIRSPHVPSTRVLYRRVDKSALLPLPCPFPAPPLRPCLTPFPSLFYYVRLQQEHVGGRADHRLACRDPPRVGQSAYPALHRFLLLLTSFSHRGSSLSLNDPFSWKLSEYSPLHDLAYLFGRRRLISVSCLWCVDRASTILPSSAWSVPPPLVPWLGPTPETGTGRHTHPYHITGLYMCTPPVSCPIRGSSPPSVVRCFCALLSSDLCPLFCVSVCLCSVHGGQQVQVAGWGIRSPSEHRHLQVSQEGLLSIASPPSLLLACAVVRWSHVSCLPSTSQAAIPNASLLTRGPADSRSFPPDSRRFEGT